MFDPFPGENVKDSTVYSGIYFSMLDSKNELAYSPRECKEYTLKYFSDTILHSVECPYIYLDEVRMAVNGLTKYIELSLDLLHQVEKKLKIEPLSIANTTKSGWFIFSGHKDWLISPPMLSLYGLLIRTGQYHTMGQSLTETVGKIVSGKDHIIWHNGAKDGLEFILKHGYQKVFGTTEEERKTNWSYGGSLTHDSGIKTFGCGKHWSGDIARFVSKWKYHCIMSGDK